MAALELLQFEVAVLDLGSKRVFPLMFSTFFVAIASIVYELIIGGISSYLLGNSVYQFSITIGLFMTAMGIGALLSKYISQTLLTKFILIEVLLAVIGGFSAATLQSKYQKIVITQNSQDTRLFLNGNIQFSTQDEYRYFAPQSFWIIHQTLNNSYFEEVILYHCYVPSFGDWGSNLALKRRNFDLGALDIEV